MAQDQALTRMYLAFVLFHNEEAMTHGHLLSTKISGCSCFGATKDVPIELTDKKGKTIAVRMQTGLVIDHSIDEQGARLFLRLFDIKPRDESGLSEQVIVFRSATRISPGYTTKDLESIDLGKGYSFVYETHWLP